MARLLIIAKGGFGDVLPLLAIGVRLQEEGHLVTVAAEPHHADICARARLSHVGVGRDGRLLSGWRARFDSMLSAGALRAEVEALLPLARRTDALLGNQLAYAGALVRDLTGRPWIYCAASPLALPSLQDPPLWPFLQALQRRAPGQALPARLYARLIRAGAGLALGHVAALRRRLGLPPAGHPRFEMLYSQQLNLLLTSPSLVTPRPDWPARTRVTGFCRTDALLGLPPAAGEALEAFLAAGPAPVLIVPGGVRRNDPHRFAAAPLAACRALGLRAVLVSGKGGAPARDLHVTSYQPYVPLFARGRVVIHSGGIGTLGCAMRAGIPSLLRPTDWDQHDNTRLAERAGVGWRWRAGALAALLQDAARQDRLAGLAPALGAEDGAGTASAAIAQALRA